MPEYDVTLTTTHTFTVEAKNEKEAEDRAKEEYRERYADDGYDMFSSPSVFLVQRVGE